MAAPSFNFITARAELLLLLAMPDHENNPLSVEKYLKSSLGKAEHASLLNKLANDEHFKKLGLKHYLEDLARKQAIGIYFLKKENHRIAQKHQKQIQSEEEYYYEQELQDFIQAEIKRHQADVQHKYDLKEHIIETLHIYRESIEEISKVIDQLDKEEQDLHQDMQASERAYERIILTLKELISTPDEIEQTRLIHIKLSELPQKQFKPKPVMVFEPDEILHNALHNMLKHIHHPKPDFHPVRHLEDRYQQYQTAAKEKMQTLSTEKALQIKNLQKFIAAMDTTTSTLSKQPNSTIQKELEKARVMSKQYREALQNYRLQQPKSTHSGFHPSPFSNMLSLKPKPRT